MTTTPQLTVPIAIDNEPFVDDPMFEDVVRAANEALLIVFENDFDTDLDMQLVEFEEAA